jgi:hypothetical protein
MSKPKTTARPPLQLIDCAKERREESTRETRAILLELYQMACAGGIDLALVFKEASGRERMVLTGAYKASPELGVNAAALMTKRCLAMQPGLT